MDAEGDLPRDVLAAAARLDELVKRFEEHPDPAVQQRVFEMLQCVDTIHRAGLRRLDALLKVAGLQRRAVDDPEVRLLYDLYDLGEGGERQRAEAVLDVVRPSLAERGGQVEVLEANAGRVRVRLSETCGDLRGLVEQTLREGLSDLAVLDVEEAPTLAAASATFIPLASLEVRR